MTKAKQKPLIFATKSWAENVAKSIRTQPRLWRSLIAIENGLLKSDLENQEIKAPIWVMGLARAGTTATLEMLASDTSIASQKYQDFPFMLLPYLWSKFLAFTPGAKEDAVERPHGDGILISSNSPEAMEEPLWMLYWSILHQPTISQVLDQSQQQPAEFPAALKAHIGKVLLAQKRQRYLAKSNYSISRMRYLLNVFPDARFVLVVRDPIEHIESLTRQHQRFNAGVADNPLALSHLEAIGHFEFGPGRRPINCGDTKVIESILAAWRDGSELEAWAQYWTHIHKFLYESIQQDQELRKAVFVLNHQSLSDKPDASLDAIKRHCGLARETSNSSRNLSARKTYESTLSDAEQAKLRKLTADGMGIFELCQHSRKR
ncbi:MAG: sulfotransferase [Oceanococcus sp.]